jgi:hypothetical protein
MLVILIFFLFYEAGNRKRKLDKEELENLDPVYNLPSDTIMLPKIGDSDFIKWVHEADEEIIAFCNEEWIKRAPRNIKMQVDATFRTASIGMFLIILED